MTAPRTVGTILDEMPIPVASQEIGANNPPEPTPLEAYSATINDLWDEARNWLDGGKIENQGQADGVTRLRDEAKKAAKAALAQRLIQTKPHTDVADAIRAEWKPLLDKCDKIEAAAKPLTNAWLIAEQERARKAADELARLAKEAEDKARERHQAAAQSGDLAALDAAEAEVGNAAFLAREARSAEKYRPVAKVEGMARATTLRTVYDVTLSAEPTAARDLLRWAYATAPREMTEFALAMAQKASKTTGAAIPGCDVVGRQTV